MKITHLFLISELFTDHFEIEGKMGLLYGKSHCFCFLNELKLLIHFQKTSLQLTKNTLLKINILLERFCRITKNYRQVLYSILMHISVQHTFFIKAILEEHEAYFCSKLNKKLRTMPASAVKKLI